jgi:hypothetical protein
MSGQKRVGAKSGKGTDVASSRSRSPFSLCYRALSPSPVSAAIPSGDRPLDAMAPLIGQFHCWMVCDRSDFIAGIAVCVRADPIRVERGSAM